MRSRIRSVVTLLLALLLAACASKPNRAPVEERTAAPPKTTAPISVASAPSGPVTPEAAAGKPPLPGAENAGKPGYYTVRPGDTLIRLALEHGQPWRDLQRWNNLENANLIEVGQVLRMLPPAADGVMATRPVAPPARVETRPLEGSGKPPVAAASAPVVVAAAPAAAASAPAAVRDPDEDINWVWPATGSLANGFDDNKNKGLDILGKAGDPVLAAADGRVVYAGAGLRGLGNLVIVKHNATYLTAYAHNQALLVKEDQVVRRGQKIAEMGSTDAERVQLHFEIRRQGKPIDPARLLPPR